MTYDVQSFDSGDIGQSRDSGFDQLAALENHAASHDAGIAAEFAPPPGQPGAAAPDLHIDAQDEAQQLLIFARTALVPFYPSLANVYTDAQIGHLAQAAAPVMRKYGITAGAVFNQWAPEIGLALVVVPLGLQTAQAIRHDREQARAAANQPQVAADEPQASEAA